jgi:2-polyprenyl-3-methyl-5-hydroxy-6-metoxy-1,4-benzoquinol methylase
MASRLRIRHFEEALKMTSERFHNANVIDFGCADGPFLPSLSKYFNHVVGIDNNPAFIKISAKVVETMHLNNVKLIGNDNLTFDAVKSRIAGEKYQILFLLETLEHVGDKSALWESRVKFIRELFSLLDEKGIIILSVPIMVGASFFLQRLGFLLLNVKSQEKVSTTDLFKASLLNDTTNLEKMWHGGHLGFNHKKLERYLKKNFKILEKKNITFQVIYKLAR